MWTGLKEHSSVLVGLLNVPNNGFLRLEWEALCCDKADGQLCKFMMLFHAAAKGIVLFCLSIWFKPQRDMASSAPHKMLMSYNGPNPSAECSYPRITKQHREHGLTMSAASLPVVWNQSQAAALPVEEHLKSPLPPASLKLQNFAKAPVCTLQKCHIYAQIQHTISGVC